LCPIWLPVFSNFFYNEPELGLGVDSGMALTPLPSSIGRGSNPQPSDREPSALPLDHSFCFIIEMYFVFQVCLRQMDMNLLCQLWSLNETISELAFLAKERIKNEFIEEEGSEQGFVD